MHHDSHVEFFLTVTECCAVCLWD